MTWPTPGLTHCKLRTPEGTDVFTYTYSDGNGGSGTYTVTVDVSNTADPPLAVADVFTVTVRPINDDPTITTPAGAQTLLEGPGNTRVVSGISFADIDEGGSYVCEIADRSKDLIIFDDSGELRFKEVTLCRDPKKFQDFNNETNCLTLPDDNSSMNLQLHFQKTALLFLLEFRIENPLDKRSWRWKLLQLSSRQS